MSVYRFMLLGVVVLFLLPGAIWGQSRVPTATGKDKALPSAQEDATPAPEDRRESPFKELLESPAQDQEDQAGRPSKNKPATGKKSRGISYKKPTGKKSTVESLQDRPEAEPRSAWWPANSQPAPSSLLGPPLELSLRQDQDAAAEDDESEGKGESKDRLPDYLKELFKDNKGEAPKRLPTDLKKSLQQLF